MALSRLLAPCLAVTVLALPAAARVIGRSAEVSIGRETASVVESYYTVDRDPVAAARVRQIGRRLAAAARDPDFPFEFHVVEEGEVNAFALPGGFVYVFRGLLQLLPSDDALASVLAHEISHVTRRHSIRQFEKSLVLSAGITAVLSGTGTRGFGRAAGAVQAIAGLSFTRRDEADADETGINLLARAGYDPRAAAEAMRVVKRAAGDDRGTPNLLRSHPAPDDRIRRLTSLAEAIVAAGPAPSPAAGPARAVAPSPPRPVDSPPGARLAACPWMPLPVGSRWVYRTRDGQAESFLVLRVLEALDPAGHVARVEYDLQRGVSTLRLLAAAGEQLYSRAAGASGRAAEWRLEASFSPAASGAGPAPTELVQVPAGTFTALRVPHPVTEGASPAVDWYAAGVGLVKRVRGGVVQELTSYHLPGSPSGSSLP